MSFQDLVRELGAPDPADPWHFIAGVVDAAPSGSPSTVPVMLSGGVVQSLRYPQGVTLTEGTTVWVACKGTSAMFVAFVLA